MDCTTTAEPSANMSAAAHRKRWQLSPRAAFYLQASITVSFLAGSSAPTPLYAIYQAQWGFSAAMLTLVFAVYAIAVLLALLVAGRLSDHIGRRPVLIGATVAQAVVMLLFATAASASDLLWARTLQGLSAGAALAAIGAGLLDLDKTRGPLANALAPLLGTPTGGVLAALMVTYLPEPMHLVYAALAAVFLLQGAGVALTVETAQVHPGALASLSPRFRIPAGVRKPLLLALPAIAAVWALGGFYASLGPTLVRSLLGSSSLLIGSSALFALAGSGAAAVLALRGCQPRTLLRIGAAAPLAGLLTVLAALSSQSVVTFLLGTAIAGAGFGTGFQGAIRTVVSRIAPHERAGVLSMLFVVSYLAMGAPAIWAGYHLAHHGDMLSTAHEFGAAVMGLALLALAGALRRES